MREQVKEAQDEDGLTEEAGVEQPEAAAE